MKNLFGSRLLNIGASTLLSGGLLSHGGLGGYISDAARRVIGLGLADFRTVPYITSPRTATS